MNRLSLSKWIGVFAVPAASAMALAACLAWSAGVAVAAEARIAEPARPIAGQAAIVEPALRTGDIPSLTCKLREEVIGAVEKGVGGAQFSSVIADPRVLVALEQQELISRVGEETVAEIARREGGVQFLTAFLGDQAWLESFLVCDSPNASYGQSDVSSPKAIENLHLLHRYGQDLDKPVYRRLATAMALKAHMVPYRLVARFKQIQAAHRQGLLHASFDTLDVREMGWAIYLGYGYAGTAGDTREYEYLLDERQTKIGDYINACWAVWWLDFNVYGDWLQGTGFFTPWLHAFGCREEAARKVGGQCEDLSRYGWAVARAHGVMAGLAGQPGHCAYVVRVGEGWPIAYDVFGPAATDFHLPGWDGTTYASVHALYEPVQHDRPHFLAANRLVMLAKLLSAQGTPEVRVVPRLRYAMYRGDIGTTLPDFSKLAHATNGTAKGFDLEAVRPAPPEHFVVVWEGAVEVTRPGETRVVLHSDDQSRLWLDGKLVLEAIVSQQEKKLELAAGRHPVRLEYCQAGGPYVLEVGFHGIKHPGLWKDAYAQAMRAQPLNYRTWLEYIAALEESAGVPPETWRELAGAAVDAFAPYHEAAWALAHRAIKKVLPTMTPAQRLAFFAECHQKLRQEKARQFEGYRFDNVLGWQADHLGDAALQLDFFACVLRIHSANPPGDRLFSVVLDWGQNRFSKSDPKTAAQFAKIVGDYFREQGGDKDRMRSRFEKGLRTATERSDVEAARVWMTLAKELLPPLQPADVHLSAEQARAFPKIEPFAGQLLSADGLLRTSTTCPHDRPLSYGAFLRGTNFGGFFHTAAEENPWAQVQLPGDALLSGIVLVNRYESLDQNQVPLKVSVSTDGKTWIELASFLKSEKVFRVDLSGKKVQAKYVRVERPTTPGRREPFNLRALSIYGQRLY